MGMKKDPGLGLIQGACAACWAKVYESLAVLDDAYNVWAGRCPHCGAVNLLSMTSLRGYSSAGMTLVLPTDEERASNHLPAVCPTRGSHGPATAHGTLAGEIGHIITGEPSK